MPEWNGMEDFKNGMENNLLYSIPIPYQISLMALTEKYLQIVMTKNMWKRLAANNLPTIG